MNPVAGWRSTTLAVLTFLTVLIPPVQEFIVANTPLSVTGIIGLVVTVYLAFVARR